MNEALHEEFDHDELAGEARATVQVLGLPRSGTTVLMQALAASGSVGYSSNVMALFWRTPWVGAAIHRHLGANATTSFRSEGGRTPEPLDPHELGYFWRAALGHSSNALQRDADPWPAAELRRQLDLVTKAFEAPTVYKNFLVPSHVDHLLAVGNQRFIIASRPLEDVAASLLQSRRRLGTPADAWFGPAPIGAAREFESEIDRVAFQAVRLQQHLDASGVARLPESITVEYAALCADPRAEIGRALEHIGAAEATHELPDSFVDHRAFQELDADDAARLAKRLDHYQEEH